VAIDSYKEMVTYSGAQDPTTRRLLEEILAKEEEHAEDLSSMLNAVAPAAPRCRARPREVTDGLEFGENYASRRVTPMADTDSPPVTPAVRLFFLRSYEGVACSRATAVGGGRWHVARLILTTMILAISACYLSHRRRDSRARTQVRQAVERWEGEGGAVLPSGEVRG
jgi:hypothetical protein